MKYKSPLISACIVALILLAALAMPAKALDCPPCDKIRQLIAQQGVWIVASRPDGQPGSGSVTDPYDGSTAAKFDALMDSFPAYTKIHLGPGTFLSNGSGWGTPLGFFMKKGQQVLGAGRDLTIVKLMNAFPISGTNPWYAAELFTHRYNVDGSDSVVADLTVDCNSDYFATQLGVNSYKLNAVTLRGNNCTIRNVHVIHGHGDFASRLEASTVVIATWYDGLANQSITGAVIEDCLVDQTTIDYGSAIDLLASPNGGDSASGVMRNNVVKGWAGTSVFGFLGKDIELTGNTVIDCSLFLYGDTGINDHITVRGNQALGVGTGSGGLIPGGAGFVSFSSGGPGAEVHHLTIEDNTIVAWPLTNDDPTTALLNLFGESTGIRSNYVIQNNLIALDPRSPAATYCSWRLAGVDQVLILGNSYDRPHYSFIYPTATNVTVNDGPTLLPPPQP